jgi:NarL family two-component system response regulator LiaR
MVPSKQEEIIRVLIVDDHDIIREGLRAVLEVTPDIEVIGEAADGEKAISLTHSLQPDVIVMDLVMPGMDGIEAIEHIAREYPTSRILVLTTFAGEDLLFPAIKAGALGYQLKDSKSEDLIRSIREVYRGESSLHPKIARMVLQELKMPVQRGESSLHPKIARMVLQELKMPVQAPRTTDPLTARELEVLGLVAEGADNAEIAGKLVISEATVRSHLSHILDKLHLANRTQAALYALREGIASLDEADDDE